MLDTWLDHARFRWVGLKTFDSAIFLNQQHLKGLFLALVLGAIHPRTAYGHARNREAQRNRTLFEQSANIGRWNMPLDDITAHGGSVA